MAEVAEITTEVCEAVLDASAVEAERVGITQVVDSD